MDRTAKAALDAADTAVGQLIDDLQDVELSLGDKARLVDAAWRIRDAMLPAFGGDDE